MFILPFEVSKPSFSISILDKMLLIGSCFTENIGKKLADNKFKVMANPFGVIYNPVSLLKTLRLAVGLQPDDHRIIEVDQIFYHWDIHSAISDQSKESLIKTLKKQYELTHSFILESSTLVISFGTSWVYRHSSNTEIVANCHKVPQKEFSKSLLRVDEIIENYFETIQLLRSLNPELNIILTVSPVRHIRDGLIENNLSKSILIQAAHEIVSQDQKASYFPSYEILIDVLRDYRFYKGDMVHPSDQAIDFIWKKFSDSYFDQDTLDFIADWGKILKALNHRPFHIHSSAHQSFLKTIEQKLHALSNMVDVGAELKTIKNQLLDS